MKSKKLLLVFLSIMLSSFLYAQDNREKGKATNQKNSEVTFAVGMHCEACKAKIEKNISWEKGVKDLKVDLEKKTVFLSFNPQKTSVEKLKKAIEKLGYSCQEKE